MMSVGMGGLAGSPSQKSVAIARLTQEVRNYAQPYQASSLKAKKQSQQGF